MDADNTTHAYLDMDQTFHLTNSMLIMATTADSNNMVVAEGETRGRGQSIRNASMMLSGDQMSVRRASEVLVPLLSSSQIESRSAMNRMSI